MPVDAPVTTTLFRSAIPVLLAMQDIRCTSCSIWTVYTFPGPACIGYLGGMVFPAKTDRARILSAAMEQLARDGMEKLSLRSLAASLDLAPNALEWLFASRSQLEAAITAEITEHVHESLRKAAGRKAPEQAIRA